MKGGTEMKINKSPQRLVLILFFLTLLFFCFVTSIASNDLTAIVIDDKGKTYKVSDLYAKYTADGLYLGSAPERVKKSLVIVLLNCVEDRVTFTKVLDITFSSMKRVIFQNAKVPENLQVFFKDKGKPICIEMQDGSSIFLSGNLFIEIDAQGTQRRNIKIDRYLFKAGETESKNILLRNNIMLRGFGGRAKSTSGIEGDFWISLSETKSIEFDN